MPNQPGPSQVEGHVATDGAQHVAHVVDLREQVDLLPRAVRGATAARVASQRRNPVRRQRVGQAREQADSHRSRPEPGWMS